MKFLRPLFLILGLSFLNNSFSQEPTRCGTDEILEQQLLDPEFERSFNTVMDVLSSQSQRASSNETLTIPVVVHVFHDGDDYGTGSNIADEVIYDAIANLNACFAGEPWHTTTHSGVTHPYSDSNIEFCLASIDPDGNPTNGITRHNPDSLGTYTTQGMITTTGLVANSEIALKSLSVWDVEKYCNIWVLHKLNGGSSPLGFAYLPPNNNSVADGIVCYVNVFGFEEPWLINNFNKNGTLVHEMGHYLGLLHTFNFTSSCNAETNCVSQGDKLCDTPPTTGSVGCSPISCPETMVENFMDYSNDGCMDRFSPDGVNRMRTQLLTYRPELLDPTNTACGIPNGLDVKISNIITPNVGCDPIMSGVNYEIRNLGSDTLTETTINYYVNDQIGSLIWTGNLGFGEAEIVTIPDFNVGFGPVNITVEAVPLGDINNENNTATFEYDNYEGVYVDVEIDFDALPYGIEWELHEVVNGNLVNPPLYSFGNYDNATYSCNSASHTFCLPEGDYQIVVTDIFNNGLSYIFCGSGDYTSGDFTIVTGTDTLNYYQGGWTGDLDLPFTISLGCPPLGDCPWDIDGDGIVAVSDIIIILQNFGLFYDCSPMDFDQDGVIGVNDLLDAISVFGLSCSTGQLFPEGEFEMFLKKEKDGELLRTTLYNVMGQEVQDFDYIDTGMYIIVQEWMVPDVGVFKTNTKIFKE